MAMDPKQERALHDGTASEDDFPRETDRESVREQAENPPVEERPRPRRRTAAMADVRVNQESGTPVDQLAREMGAEPVPEMGRAPRNKTNGDEPERAEAAPELTEQPLPRPTRDEAPPSVARGEARRTLKARREHSKGDGNFPEVEPSPKLIDERPEDRKPRDLPKARDDRSAPKGNVTVGQEDRNPDLVVRDEQEPELPVRPSGFTTARSAAGGPVIPPRPMAEAKTTASTRGQVTPAARNAQRAPKAVAAKRTSAAKRTTSAAKKTTSAARKTTGAARKTTGAARKTGGTARKTTSTAKRRTATARRAGTTARARGKATTPRSRAKPSPRSRAKPRRPKRKR